jgi:haloalkane dehalogenase
MLAEIEQGLKRDFRSKPAGIAWAMKDIAFTPDVLEQLWLDTFPDVEVLRIEDAGHYPQEDAHEVIVPALLSHLGDTDTTRA